ncbi:transposase domain-containing protein, partial [Streptomyces sp. NPDC054775]
MQRSSLVRAVDQDSLSRRSCVAPSLCPAVCADGHHPCGRCGRGAVRSGYLGELTAVVPFELVDVVLAETRTVQQRLSDLPSRVG